MTLDSQKGTARFVEGEVPVSPTTGHRPSIFTSVEVRVPMDRYIDGKAAADPLNNETFCRFASILGPEKFLVVLNHFRPQVHEVLNAQVLAVGFADAIKNMGYEIDPQAIAEDLYGIFLEVVCDNEPDEEYERYVEVTQPLGFGGVEALEKAVGGLMDRAREVVLKGE